MANETTPERTHILGKTPPDVAEATRADRFSIEAAARASCPADKVREAKAAFAQTLDDGLRTNYATRKRVDAIEVLIRAIVADTLEQRSR
jgi:hypothetical protein